MILALFLACAPAPDRIDPLVLDAALRASPEDYTLVDVRTGFEFAGGHIEGAVSMPYPGVLWSAGDLAPAEGQTVVLICLSGHRSRFPLATMREAHPGVTVVDLAGGMMAWRAAGLPTVEGPAAP